MLRKRNISLVLLIIFVFFSITACTDTVDEKDAEAAAKYQAGMFANMQADEQKIDEEEAYNIIEELTQPKYDGRKAGTEGNLAAAQYIADYFKKIGLENPQGLKNYIQYHEQAVVDLEGEPLLQILASNGKVLKQYKNAENFALRSLDDATNNIDITAPLYVAKDAGELSQVNEAIIGKVILISKEVRQNVDYYNLLSHMDEYGIQAVISEYDIKSDERVYGQLTITPMIGPWLRGQYNPFMYVDNDTYAELVEAAANNQRIRFKCDYSMEDMAAAPNVVGMIPGSDPLLKDEYIIIGGHFDHVGNNANGTYNPGAFDNASGTAAMMEAARTIMESKAVPKKSIIFIAFNGEEGGLIGSEFYANYPVYPLDKAVMINLDMVGNASEVPLSLVTSRNVDPEFKNELMKMAEELNIDCISDIEGASDHSSFEKVGVPAVSLIGEDFLNGYHNVGDNIEDISKVKLEQIIKLVLYYIDRNAF